MGQLVIDKPSYAVIVNEDSEGTPWIGLHIQTSSMSLVVFLADVAGYRRVAATMHDNIMKAGKEASKPRLITSSAPLNGHGNLPEGA